MKSEVTRYCCLSAAVRISTHQQESILSNLANGKWIRIHNDVLECLVAQDGVGVISNCVSAGISSEDATDFVDVLERYGFLNVTGQIRAKDEWIDFTLQSAYLNVTDYCNLKCRHCYFGSHPGLSHGVTNEQMKEIVDRLYAGGIRFLVVAGGEPLARPGIHDLLAYIATKKFDEVTVLTNGTLIDDELSSVLASTVNNVHISLDGSDEATNSLIRGANAFERTVQGIRRLKMAGVKKIRVVTTVTASNIEKMREMQDLCSSLGAEFGTAIFADVGRGHAKRHLAPSRKKLVRFFTSEIASMACDSTCLDVQAGVTCGSGVSMISVDCRGDVFPCHLLHRSEFKIGNLMLQANLTEMMKDSSVVASFRGRTVEYRKCHGCPVEYFCKGGCLAHTIAAHENEVDGWKERDPYCEVHHKVISAQLWGK